MGADDTYDELKVEKDWVFISDNSFRRAVLGFKREW
jgi:hypothetical protein